MKFYPTLNETLAKRFEPGTEDGISEIRDIVNHGIMGGFSDFIYNYEVEQFFDEFEYEIEDRLGDMGLTPNDIVDDVNNWTVRDLKVRSVWIVVESWCSHVIDLIDDTEDQEVDLAMVS